MSYHGLGTPRFGGAPRRPHGGRFGTPRPYRSGWRQYVETYNGPIFTTGLVCDEPSDPSTCRLGIVSAVVLQAALEGEQS